MADLFAAFKQRTLSQVGSEDEPRAEGDLSMKGSIDRRAAEVCRLVNECGDFCTTSVCSGRVCVYGYASAMGGKGSRKGASGSVVFMSHDPLIPLDECVSAVVSAVEDALKTEDEPPASVFFKFEPFVLHVQCRDLASASQLLSTATMSGFRESGLAPCNGRVAVAIRCSIRLEAPLVRDGRWLFSESVDGKTISSAGRGYVQELVETANSRFAVNFERIFRLEGAVRELQPTQTQQQQQKHVPSHEQLQSRPQKQRQKPSDNPDGMRQKTKEPHTMYSDQRVSARTRRRLTAQSDAGQGSMWTILCHRRSAAFLKRGLTDCGWLYQGRRVVPVPCLSTVTLGCDGSAAAKALMSSMDVKSVQAVRGLLVEDVSDRESKHISGHKIIGIPVTDAAAASFLRADFTSCNCSQSLQTNARKGGEDSGPDPTHGPDLVQMLQTECGLCNLAAIPVSSDVPANIADLSTHAAAPSKHKDMSRQESETQSLGRVGPQKPQQKVRAAVEALCKGKGLSEDVTAAVLTAVASLKWEWVGDIACVRVSHSSQQSLLHTKSEQRSQSAGIDVGWLLQREEEDSNGFIASADVLAAAAASLGAQRIALLNEIEEWQDDAPMRQSQARLLWVSSKYHAEVEQNKKTNGQRSASSTEGHVCVKENGVLYHFDITKTMFSSGNITEKMRMAQLLPELPQNPLRTMLEIAPDSANGVTVVDLYAGIGYYTLPLLIHADVKTVHACEINPNAVASLKHNLDANNVPWMTAEDKRPSDSERKLCVIHAGDNREHAPCGVADRVLLGLLPSSKPGWPVGVAALKSHGGWLHLHENVADGHGSSRSSASTFDDTVNMIIDDIRQLLTDQRRKDLAPGHEWACRLHHVERVKRYAPHVWHCVLDIQCYQCNIISATDDCKRVSEAIAEAKDCGSVPRIPGFPRLPTSHVFHSAVSPARYPVVFTGCTDIVPPEASENWKQKRYLSKRCSADRMVTVHESASACLDFVNRNFSYRAMPMGALLDECYNKETDSSSGKAFFYLRAVGENPRKDVAHFEDDFPSLSQDLPFVGRTLPCLKEKTYFSSVLRISSPGMQLWTHFDVMDNALVQVTGRKRVLLFPPQCDAALHVPLNGSSSPVIDVDDMQQQQFPGYAEARAQALEVVLEPGDVLFIPSLFFHNIRNVGDTVSISVNTFWMHLPAEMYDLHRDLYGNKDPKEAAAALSAVTKMVETLPTHYAKFYLDRVRRIERRAA